MSAIKVKASKDFIEMSVTDKLAFGGYVRTMMGNVAGLGKFPFPTVPLSGALPIVSLSSLDSDLNAKNNAWLANPSLIDALELSEIDWIAGYDQDCDYVNSIAKNNPAVIDMSGYHKTKDVRSVTHVPTTPVMKSADSSVTGGFDVELGIQKDATGFGGVLYTPNLTPVVNGSQVTFSFTLMGDVPAQIAFVTSQSRKFSFRNLISLIKMKLMAWAFNAAGMSNPTPPSDNSIK